MPAPGDGGGNVMEGYDPGQITKSRQYFRFRLAVLPAYHPIVGSAHDGDDGRGHTVDFWDIPLMGPNRIGVIGEPMEFQGGVSYNRIGRDTPDSWNWSVYKSSSETLGEGDLVASETGDDDHHFTWTPTEDGIFRVELQTEHRKSDRSTDGARFVRVFEGPFDSDLSKTIEFVDTFATDEGGHEVTLTYKPLGPGFTTTFEDWARIVVDIRAYYSDFSPVEEDDRYDFQSDSALSTGDTPSATVQFNGLLIANTVIEDHASETLTFRMMSPGSALKKMPLVGYKTTIQQETDVGTVTLPAEYPIMFGDPDHGISLPDGTTINVVEYIKQNDENFPVHAISGMHYSDPVYHLLQRHTNFTRWFDVYLEQDGDFHHFPYSMGQGDIWSQLKKFQDSRMGVLFSDKKGKLYFSRDVAFQDDVWWGGNIPTPMYTFTREDIIDIHVDHNPYQVAQVQLTGMDDKNRPYFSRYPNDPDTIGRIEKRQGLRPYKQSRLSTWAARLYSLMNQPDNVTLTALGIMRFWECQDVLGLDYVDKAGIRDLNG